MHVLVVEDDRSTRDLLTFQAEDVEFELDGVEVEIVGAEDATSALEAITRQMPDVMLLDLGLPGLDGEGLLTLLRSQESTRNLPVIVVTCRDVEGSTRARLMDHLRCKRILQKGVYDTAELVAAIADAVEEST